jgi:hypothetical protein
MASIHGPQLSQSYGPCPDCGYFQCPNAAGGKYDGCPYATMPPSGLTLEDYTADATTTSVRDGRQLSPSYEPCTECGYFECPNAVGGEYDGCPYATVYEVSVRYDPYTGYGYEHLPRSSNPRGWTFENTGGCRLYALGIKRLAPCSEA